MKRFTNCVALIFLLFQASSAADKQFTGTEAETWSLTCNASNHFTGPIKEEDFMVSILLNASQPLGHDSQWLIKLTMESDVPQEGQVLSTLNRTKYFPRGHIRRLASAFLQLNTVGHALGWSKAPPIDSDESKLRNWKYMCDYTKQDILALPSNEPPDFTVTSSTKMVCCTGDGCRAKIDGDTTTKVSFLRVAIMRAQEDITSEKAICEIRQKTVKNCTVINGSVVFFEGIMTSSGAWLECHVPRELGCEFKCLMINESGEKYELPLSHSFKDSKHCEKAGAHDPSSTTNVPLSSIAGIVIPIVVVVLIIIAVVVVIFVCRKRCHIQRGTNVPEVNVMLGKTTPKDEEDNQ